MKGDGSRRERFRVVEAEKGRQVQPSLGAFRNAFLNRVLPTCIFYFVLSSSLKKLYSLSIELRKTTQVG